MTDTSALTWTPPGRGTWELVADHYPRPITAAIEPFCEVWSDASTTWMHDIGLPIKRATMTTVNGLPYVCIDAGGGGRKPPPAWVLKAFMKLSPSMRRAERRLGEVIATRPWTAAVAQWYDSDRAAAIERVLALADVDVAELDDAALAAHLRRCIDTAMSCGHQHLMLHAHDSFAPGLFVVRAMDWGLDQETAIRLLQGASPASTGASDELRALRRSVAGRHAGSIDELRSLGPEVAEALDRFLRYHGARIIDGYDVDNVTIGESPALVVRLATAVDPLDAGPQHEARLAAARELLDPSVHAAFEAELADARRVYGVRDDNSSILIAWPVGVTRLAMLEAGRRLEGRGLVDDPGLAIDATIEELTVALAGGPIDHAALGRRSRHRSTLRAADAPATLGPPMAASPDLPGALGLVFRIFAVFDGKPDPAAPLTGLGIGSTPYTGRARLVTGGSNAITDFEPGDVLVAPMTSPSYNVVLSLAGALVTEAGGALSHAGIMARELDLPAVLGAAGATTLIRDGDLVTVDPVEGRVRVTRAAVTAS